MKDLKKILDMHYNARNTAFELSIDKPDPLFVVKKHIHDKNIDEIALICALLSYGNARQIVKTLLLLDFDLLDDRDSMFKTSFPLYRFQTSNDIKELFLCLNDIINNHGGIKYIFVEAYNIDGNVISGINAIIDLLRSKIANMTPGLDFLIGRRSIKLKSSSPLKRWNMFLRWLVRKDNIDIGLWQDCVSTRDLILPLDTHTFRLSKQLGLLKRKTYDLQSAIDITNNLRQFCSNDPVKYDFALYRIGQEKKFINISH